MMKKKIYDRKDIYTYIFMTIYLFTTVISLLAIIAEYNSIFVFEFNVVNFLIAISRIIILINIVISEIVYNKGINDCFKKLIYIESLVLSFFMIIPLLGFVENLLTVFRKDTYFLWLTVAAFTIVSGSLVLEKIEKVQIGNNLIIDHINNKGIIFDIVLSILYLFIPVITYKMKIVVYSMIIVFLLIVFSLINKIGIIKKKL